MYVQYKIRKLTKKDSNGRCCIHPPHKLHFIILFTTKNFPHLPSFRYKATLEANNPKLALF